MEGAAITRRGCSNSRLVASVLAWYTVLPACSLAFLQLAVSLKLVA